MQLPSERMQDGCFEIASFKQSAKPINMHPRIAYAPCATWLTASEKRVLVEAIARDAGQKQEGSIVEALLDPRVWLTGVIYFCFVAGLYGVGFWLPTIISGMGVKSPLNVGFLTAMPYAAGAIGMVLVGNSADYHRERRWHVAIPAGLGALG